MLCCERLENSHSDFFTVYNFFYSIQWILKFVKVLWISACWNGAQRNEIRLISGASAEPVGIHDLQFAQDFAPVS